MLDHHGDPPAPGDSPQADRLAEVKAPNALIIGLGHLLLSDEGVGIHTLRQLEQGFDFTPEVELVDGGTTGLDLLELFRQHDLILLLDALFAPDAAPGDIQILCNDAILAALSKKMSMHHLGISDVLALTQLLDYRPSEIVLLGVVPENLELGTELSAPVQAQLPEILSRVQKILGDWKISMRPRQAGGVIPSPTGAGLFLGTALDAH
ncbi:HyaD/HybD family hydrogenase maturation endopeptidase [Thiorhodovibrio frisius]|uniref:Hydrogenase maturation protease n=1 Tax=Thiorhodovibrio frisius TaxID=631362 RepID=H8Z4W6_9GAMM|nr:HyaD/HybD family hydrogenase maturation endopeptidase [Thiorhodovibrio frisius]EIC20373.1 hydrogenase maturation protease [Thiorhodovibrio frisius]WPL21113.1 Hydrogenase 2 maturation protease [Thiorhodovibrio frisius]